MLKLFIITVIIRETFFDYVIYCKNLFIMIDLTLIGNENRKEM